MVPFADIEEEPAPWTKAPWNLPPDGPIGLPDVDCGEGGRIPEDSRWLGLDGLRKPDEGPRTPDEEGGIEGPPEADGCDGYNFPAGEGGSELDHVEEDDVDEDELEDNELEDDELRDEDDVDELTVDDEFV